MKYDILYNELIGCSAYERNELCRQQKCGSGYFVNRFRFHQQKTKNDGWQFF